MNIKFRLTLLSFLQFFVWGAWLTTIATYCLSTKGWTFPQFGAIFSTLGIASIITPPIVGILVDKYINSEKLYGILHILYGIMMFFVPGINDPEQLYWIILIAMFFYMPTISLSYSLIYRVLSDNNSDVVTNFPKIRVWGTVGFIIAMWITNFTNFDYTQSDILSFNFIKLATPTPIQFYIASAGAVILGLYAFTLPSCPPENNKKDANGILEKLGLNAFVLFKNPKMASFFIFSMFLGAALQLTNMYADVFIDSFKSIAAYKDSFAVKYSTVIVSISQISETLFILAIPFFLKKFGIKKVMLMSMLAWVLRFGLFSVGYPTGFGLFALILSMIVYGMAFDFFNISGSLFVETSTDSKLRGSAQGLFMMMTNGIGAIIGSKVSGFIIEKYFINTDGSTNWSGAWLTFSIYALVIAVLFGLMFKHKHNPEAIGNVSH